MQKLLAAGPRRFARGPSQKEPMKERDPSPDGNARNSGHAPPNRRGSAQSPPRRARHRGLLVLGGAYAILNTPLDAIPDLSDVQVIVFTEYPGQAPQVVEDQVTYPLSTAMLAVPYAKVVRGYSFFGFSFVYVIFEDGTDLYWARSRVLESLNFVSRPPADRRHARRSARMPRAWAGSTSTRWSTAPEGTTWPSFARSRTGTCATSSRRCPASPRWPASAATSASTRSRSTRTSSPPTGSRSHHVRDAIQRSNSDIGGSLIEQAETEFMVRGRGYVAVHRDLEQIALGADESGTPILLRNVANVSLGPRAAPRPHVDLDGEGEVAAGSSSCASARTRSRPSTG